jgi:hypothetical protein
MAHFVRGHFRKGGTFVKGHIRRNPGNANNAAAIVALIAGAVALIVGAIQLITFIVQKMVEAFGVQDTVIAFSFGFGLLLILIAAGAGAVWIILSPIAVVAATPYAIKLVREYRNKTKDGSNVQSHDKMD